MSQKIRIQVPPPPPGPPPGATTTPVLFKDTVFACLYQGMIQGAGHLVCAYHSWPSLEDVFHSIGRLETIPFVTYRKLSHERKPAEPDCKFITGEVISAEHLATYKEDAIQPSHLKHVREQIVMPGIRAKFFTDVYASKEAMTVNLPIREVKHPILGTLVIAAARLWIPHNLEYLVTSQVLPIATVRCLQLLIDHLNLPNAMVKNDNETMAHRRTWEEIDLSPSITDQTDSIGISFVTDSQDAGLHTVYVCFLSKEATDLLDKNQSTLGPVKRSPLRTSFSEAREMERKKSVDNLIDSLRKDLSI
jgi:hypothetical protein